MSKTKNAIIGFVAGGALIASSGSAIQAAFANESAPDNGTAPTANTATGAPEHQIPYALPYVALKNIQGQFAWNQDVSLSNQDLNSFLYRSSQYLCASQSNGAVALGEADGSTAAESGVIEHIKISGDVNNEFIASVEEYIKEAPVKKIMGCTCMGNPVDGRASANVEVGGFRLFALIEDAQPNEDANTITFISRDGYRIALPLSYVTQRYSLIVSSVNGEDTSSALGCSNQLWLGATAARSFARDIVSIEITAEKEVPAVPSLADTANQPNVSVMGGEAVS